MVNNVLTFLSLLLLVALPAEAADRGMIELKSLSEVEITVENDKGEKVILRVAAAMANITPGDTVIFTNYYSNSGDNPVDNVVLTNPVPEHRLYVDGSAEGKGTRIEFSVDQGQSYGLPEKLKMEDEDGTERDANAADYTHIRWTLAGSIGEGGTGRVSFKAKVQ